jgi:proton-translocating NADH-quinone oxidoreductase chain N
LLSLAQAAMVLFPSLNFFTSDPIGVSKLFNISLAVDGLTMVLLLSIALVLLTVLLVCNSLIKDADRKFDFMNVLLVSVIGMNGIVLVKDIFSMYVFIEVVSISSFILIAFNKDRDALESSYKYIVFSAIATVMMLTSIALIMLFSQGTSFAAISSAIKNSSTNALMLAAIAIYISGLFIKGGLMPFHGWLPGAYTTAPNSTSVLLAGMITKAVGIYPLIRIVYSVFGYSSSINNVLLIIGSLSIVIAAFAALTQSDMKRMLAYSSISQVGYIVLSLGSGTLLGVAGAVFHLFNHSIFKSLLFVNAATIENQTGSRDMDKMSGLAQRMPWTGATSALASLSVAGIPPLSGFWSKLLIIIALWTSNHYSYAIIAVLASVVTLSYMLTLQRKLFFGKLSANVENVSEADGAMLLPALIMAGILIAVSILFPFIIGSFIVPINGL